MVSISIIMGAEKKVYKIKPNRKLRVNSTRPLDDPPEDTSL